MCFLKTQRLFLRELKQDDFPALCKTLQDPIAMTAYEHAFADAEVQDWLDRQLAHYRQYGFGLWAVILKETQQFIGQCGLTMQPIEDRQVLEVGYLFQRAFWHRGFATEAAVACRNYAFDVLHADEVFSIIRNSNTPSQAVARRNGMTVRGQFVKHYYGIDMPHLIFSIRKEERICDESI